MIFTSNAIFDVIKGGITVIIVITYLASASHNSLQRQPVLPRFQVLNDGPAPFLTVPYLVADSAQVFLLFILQALQQLVQVDKLGFEFGGLFIG
jgi:hypothetical protein